jgi:molybdate transport system regulatory protein
MYFVTYRGMELRFKLWLAEEPEAGGDGYLGEGRFQLLFAIDRAGSLRKAAEELGISYRKAWGDIRAAEAHLGFELLRRQRGGSSGGSSALTERARQLLLAFEKVKTNIQILVTREFDKHIEPIFVSHEGHEGKRKLKVKS